MTASPDGDVLILCLETRSCTVWTGARKQRGFIVHEVATWDLFSYMNEPGGRRLVEEIARRCATIIRKKQLRIALLVISMPGSLQGTVVLGSSRLGIYEEVDFAKGMRDLTKLPCTIHHDVTSMAVGASLDVSADGTVTAKPELDPFVYLHVDEGVGAGVYVDRRPFYGAGLAGHIGRMLVQMPGTYIDSFKTRGTLESICSRPSISSNIVSDYTDERKKRPFFQPSTPFQEYIQVLLNSDPENWRSIEYSRLNEGLAERDPICENAMADAIDALSYTITSVMTILNPRQIILGGRVVVDIDGFSDRLLDRTRQRAWHGVWNNTAFRIDSPSAHRQAQGSAYIVLRELGNPE